MKEKGWTITYIKSNTSCECIAGRFKTAEEKDAFIEKICIPESGWSFEELRTITIINDYNYKVSK